MFASHCPLRGLTGKPEMSVFQMLLLGNIGQPANCGPAGGGGIGLGVGVGVARTGVGVGVADGDGVTATAEPVHRETVHVPLTGSLFFAMAALSVNSLSFTCRAPLGLLVYLIELTVFRAT